MRFSDLPFYDDVKKDYEDRRRDGSSREDSVSQLVEKYSDMLTIGAEDDGPVFWIALADSQYRLKELDSAVAEKAKAALDAIPNDEWEISKSGISRRRENYSHAPMPEQTLRKARPPFNCNWADGDTYAYRLRGEEAEKRGLAGQYMVIRQVGVNSYDGKKILPQVTVSFWGSDALPANSGEFMSKPILLIRRLYGARQILLEYRAELSVSSKRAYEKLEFEYLGNFADVPYPPVHGINNFGMTSFIFDKFADDTFVRMISQDEYYKNN